MTTRATGKFKVQSWDEQSYSEIDSGGKLTRASVTQAFEGDLEGDGSVEWLMCYRPDQTADFVGLQRVSGRLGERSGSFVLRTEGTFDGKEAKGEWSVVPGSGSGELAQLRGEGGFSAPLGSEASVTLDYELE
jgi:Protein of unknown function (DUF3224)